MYIVSVDYFCSMFLLVNNMFNLLFFWSLFVIEGFFKNEGLFFRVRDLDMVVLVFEEKDRVVGKKIIWGLRIVDEVRLGV